MMRRIGYIQQLQVQIASLKQGERANRYYDPAPLRVVPALQLTPQGVLGVVAGQTLLDVHNATHPQSKNNNLINGISLNFTSHYQQMQERFGTHLTMGCAGENILIAAETQFAEMAFANGLIIVTQAGQSIPLQQVCVAVPCAPFSEYALAGEMRPPAELLKSTLQFLDGGTRGFYCQYQGEPALIQVGDAVFVVDEF
jgi:hypothetical protein